MARPLPRPLPRPRSRPTAALRLMAESPWLWQHVLSQGQAVHPGASWGLQAGARRNPCWGLPGLLGLLGSLGPHWASSALLGPKDKLGLKATQGPSGGPGAPGGSWGPNEPGPEKHLGLLGPGAVYEVSSRTLHSKCVLGAVLLIFWTLMSELATWLNECLVPNWNGLRRSRPPPPQ